MRPSTQSDVARLAGVSRATVSYAMNGRLDGRIPISQETYQRVMQAVKELDYGPDARAQALRSDSTKTIGLMMPDLRNPHFWEYANGIEQEARASGYHLILSHVALNSEIGEDILKDLSHRRIDGMILMGSYLSQSEKARKALFRKRRFMIVEISEHFHVDYPVDGIVSDYNAATTEVMSYLLGLQHRRIGMIYGVARRELGEDRLVPFLESLRAAGLPLDQTPIVECGPNIEDGYQAALKLLRLPSRPTALIVVNDLLAIGALRAAGDLNLRVPADLSQVSYDDISIANYMVPRLSTVTKDSIGIGREAVKLLLARIREPNRPQQRIRIPTRFIIRESTGPAPS